MFICWILFFILKDFNKFGCAPTLHMLAWHCTHLIAVFNFTMLRLYLATIVLLTSILGRLGKCSVNARYSVVARWVSCPFDDTKLRIFSGRSKKNCDLWFLWFVISVILGFLCNFVMSGLQCPKEYILYNIYILYYIYTLEDSAIEKRKITNHKNHKITSCIQLIYSIEKFCGIEIML